MTAFNHVTRREVRINSAITSLFSVSFRVFCSYYANIETQKPEYYKMNGRDGNASGPFILSYEDCCVSIWTCQLQETLKNTKKSDVVELLMRSFEYEPWLNAVKILFILLLFFRECLLWEENKGISSSTKTVWEVAICIGCNWC